MGEHCRILGVTLHQSPRTGSPTQDWAGRILGQSWKCDRDGGLAIGTSSAQGTWASRPVLSLFTPDSFYFIFWISILVRATEVAPIVPLQAFSSGRTSSSY